MHQNYFIKREDRLITLTISDVREIDTSRPPELVLEFEERWRLTLNARDLQTMIDSLGEETNQWIGKQVTLFYDPWIKSEDDEIPL
jgi:hypothetical protein